MKYCAACEDVFDPKVSKIAKYCSADCIYDHTNKNVSQCDWCGDDFDPDFTKSFTVSLKVCSKECEKLLQI